MLRIHTECVVRSSGGGGGHVPGHDQCPLQPGGDNINQEERGDDESHFQHGNTIII